MKRRNFIRDLGLGGAVLMGASAPIAVAEARSEKLPRGRPFRRLQREVNALQMQIDDGIFPRLQIIEPTGGANRLIFGPTDDCTVGVDPQGPAGLQLTDPEGVRVLTPAGQQFRGERTPTLFFGPTDECRISLGNQLGGGIQILDPNGLFIRNPREGEVNRLSFGAANPDTGLAECRIDVGGAPDDQLGGMRFIDPNGFVFDNIVIAKEFVESSSRTLKRDIAPIDDALAKIDRLQGVYFNWKTNRNPHSEIGLIAEDVAEVMPEAVAAGPDDGSPKGVKYAKLVAVTIEGIKDQQRQIARLEAEKVALEKQVAELRTLLGDISAKVDRLAASTGAA